MQPVPKKEPASNNSCVKLHGEKVRTYRTWVRWDSVVGKVWKTLLRGTIVNRTKYCR